eukprot:426964-Prymnesium_polylepis.1
MQQKGGGREAQDAGSLIDARSIFDVSLFAVSILMGLGVRWYLNPPRAPEWPHLWRGRDRVSWTGP